MIRTLGSCALFALALAACNNAGTATVSTPSVDASISLVEIGKEAPTFKLSNLAGEEVDTANLADKTVVLEWFNPDCPFVKYAYSEGGLGQLSQKWTDNDVVWLRINSGKPGKQGTETARNQEATQQWGLKDVLMDPKGKVGKLYGATTTPHIYIIEKGTLVYMGATDNAPMGKVKGEGKVDFVDQALVAVKDGKPVPTAVTKQYGCSVKY